MRTSIQNRFLLCLLSVVFLWITQTYASGQTSSEGWVRVDIARDTWLSNYQGEQSGSNGAASKLKLKSIIELSIIDFQPGALKGKKIQQAKLMLKVEGDRPIERVTLSTLSADWIEGNGSSYQVVKGASTFTHRVYPTERWFDSDVTAVSIGQGNTLYASVDAKPADTKGWVELDIPPEILLARVHGLSYGILLMDDTGSTWTRKGEEFKQEIFPNRFVASKDSNKSSSPYILVKLASDSPALQADKPKSIDKLSYVPADKLDPRARLTWQIDPKEYERLIGFRAKLDGQWIDPFWVPSIRSHLKHQFCMPLDRLMGKKAGLVAPGSKEAKISVQAIGLDGQLGDQQSVQIPIEVRDETPLKLDPIVSSNLSVSKQPNWDGTLEGAGTNWGVSDPLDIYVSKSNTLIPSQRSTYLRSNHLFDAKEQKVSLDLARGAWAGFQLVSKLPSTPKITWTWENAGDINPQLQTARVEFYTYREVPSGDQSIPDPLIPLATDNQFPRTASRIDNATAASNWLIETYIPPEVPAGNYKAKLSIEQGGKSVELAISIQVHSVVIPKTLSFLPEMNCYGLPANDIDYYRLAQRHRTVVNRVPYGQGGKLAEGCAPKWNNGQFDWTAFDQRFGKLFTGEAFADLPRGSVPIECFYLAMHENWPLEIEPNYNGSYWADQAFTKEYRQAWVSSIAQSFDHFAQKRWMQTRFHVYLNNKNNFKSRGWSRGSSPWLLDEPANFQDYIALRYFGLAYLDGLQDSQEARKLGGSAGIDRANGNDLPQVVFRADISRPQWQRNTLDEMLKFNVVATGAYKEYESLVLDRKFRFGQQVVVYGGNNPIGKSNASAVAWSLDAWSSGADGVLPWQTIGTAESWKKADELSLFYPTEELKIPGPIPSIRLKAYCYGQQDVELFEYLARSAQMDRYRFGAKLRSSLKLKSQDKAEGDYAEPATWSDYGSLTPEMLHLWRVQLLKLGS
ncbi:MAG: hypothetical protein ACKO3V_09900 [Pirellula sp.]